MLSVLCSILLFSIIQVQCVDDAVSYYDSYCKEDHMWDPTRMYFCQYFEKSHTSVKKPFPTVSECNTCKAFMKRIEWNQHTEKAVENLLKYSGKHFCENVRRTDKFECKQSLSKYRPQIEKLITKMMKSGNFCEVLLKCKEELGHSFAYYFSDFHHESITSYPMQFFEYFFTLENYSHDFYPYYFFNYFFKSQEHEFVPYSYFDHFYKNQTVDMDSMVYKFFDYFYKDHKTDQEGHPMKFFEYFFKDHPTDQEWHPAKFFEYFFKDHPTDQEWHPMKFFEYFFKDHKIEPEWHPASFFEYFYKDHPADQEWHPMKFFEYFFKNSTMVKDSMPHKFFEYYFSHHPESKDSFIYKCFEYFFTDHKTDPEWHPMKFIEYFFQHWPVENSFYPYQWFDYFFTNQTNMDHYNPFYFFDLFSRNSSQNEPFCTRCEKISDSRFKKWLKSVDLKQMNQVGYQAMCGGSNKNQRCRIMVDFVVAQLTISLEDVLTKDTICHTMFRCPRTPKSRMVNQYFSTFFEHFETKPEEKRCDVCKAISEIFYKIIESNKFIEFVTMEFKNGYCDEIFPNNENECKRFLKEKLPSVVNKVLDYLRNHPLCVSSCKGLKAEEHHLEFYDFFYKSDSKSCPVCRVISLILKLSLRSDEFKLLVNHKFLTTKCNNIFSTISKCSKFMESEYKPIVKNMTKVLDKDNLCRSSCSITAPIIKTETPCEICDEVIEELEELKLTSPTVDIGLNMVCSKFHDTKNEKCTLLINQYRTQIKSLVLTQKSKEEICRTINQCSSNLIFTGIFNHYFQYL